MKMYDRNKKYIKKTEAMKLLEFTRSWTNGCSGVVVTAKGYHGGRSFTGFIGYFDSKRSANAKLRGLKPEDFDYNLHGEFIIKQVPFIGTLHKDYIKHRDVSIKYARKQQVRREKSE